MLKIEAPLSAGARRAGLGLPYKGTGSKKEIAFNALDRNKKSLGLNLGMKEGKEIFFKLAENYDAIMVLEIESGDLGKIKQVGMPVKLSQTPGHVRCLAPALGENTTGILMELGYSREEIKSLGERGVIQ